MGGDTEQFDNDLQAENEAKQVNPKKRKWSNNRM